MFADRMGADHPYVAEASVALAAVLRDAGEPSAALDQAEHALSIYTAAYGAKHRATGRPALFAMHSSDDRPTAQPGRLQMHWCTALSPHRGLHGLDAAMS